MGIDNTMKESFDGEREGGADSNIEYLQTCLQRAKAASKTFEKRLSESTGATQSAEAFRLILVNLPQRTADDIRSLLPYFEAQNNAAQKASVEEAIQVLERISVAPDATPEQVQSALADLRHAFSLIDAISL